MEEGGQKVHTWKNWVCEEKQEVCFKREKTKEKKIKCR